MKHLKHVFLSFALLLLAFSRAQAGGNILPNGDIEDGKDGQPLFWYSSVFRDEKLERAEAEFKQVKDPDSKHKRVLYMKYFSGTERAFWRLNMNAEDSKKKIKAGKKYEFSMWLRYELAELPAKGITPIVARWNLWGSDNEDINTAMLTPLGALDGYKGQNPVPAQMEIKTDWKEYKAVFAIPKEAVFYATSVQIWLNLPGEMWVDDFSIVEVPDETPVGPFRE